MYIDSTSKTGYMLDHHPGIKNAEIEPHTRNTGLKLNWLPWTGSRLDLRGLRKQVKEGGLVRGTFGICFEIKLVK